MSYAMANPDVAGSAHDVLKGVDIELAPGERLGLIGVNGAGKSTLLRIMAKIFAPVSGSVVWAAAAPESLLSLGLGFRDDLTGRENAYLSAVLQGFSRQESADLLGDIEDFCELGQFFDEPVKSYSSGMRARLGFATALLNNSRVLLVDEVLGVGDAAFRKKARQSLIRQFDQDRGVVIVSHTEYQIKTLCTRAVWLDGGEVRMNGEPEEVLEAYSKSGN